MPTSAPPSSHTGNGNGTAPPSTVRIASPFKAGDTRELGTSGLLHTSGFLFDEFLPQLRGMQGAKMYQEMASNDPVLAAFLYAVTMSMRQVEWQVTPADKTPQALKAADFVTQVLFEDMTHSWNDFLSEVMSMCTFGYSMFEKVWKIRGGRTGNPKTDSQFNDKKIGLRKLAPRSQLTVWRWLIDINGEVQGVEQIVYNQGVYTPGAKGGDGADANKFAGGKATIPRGKMLLFRTESLRDNPEGRSLLRPCYVPYLRKKTIEDAEGRLAMRSAGIVELKIPAVYLDPAADSTTLAAYQNYKTIVTALAQDRTGSIILPSDVDDKGHPLYELTYKVADGRRPMDQGNIIERLDKRMVMSVLADFLMLGHAQHGSYALAATKSDLFTTALEGFLNIIEDQVNRDLLVQMWDYNGFDLELIPRVEHGQVEAPDLAKLGAAITAWAAAGMPLFPDLQLENALRRMAQLPEVEEDSFAVQLAEAKQAADLAQQKALTAHPPAAAPPPPLPGMPPKPGAPSPNGAGSSAVTATRDKPTLGNRPDRAQPRPAAQPASVLARPTATGTSKK